MFIFACLSHIRFILYITRYISTCYKRNVVERKKNLRFILFTLVHRTLRIAALQKRSVVERKKKRRTKQRLQTKDRVSNKQHAETSTKRERERERERERKRKHFRTGPTVSNETKSGNLLYFSYITFVMHWDLASNHVDTCVSVTLDLPSMSILAYLSHLRFIFFTLVHQTLHICALQKEYCRTQEEH